ncbi:Na+/H+ antiporter subunit B [Geobacter sp. DSM 9736]|uniref:Na+/H+ antiporter subunit B n=1 Tax=Geobacter sp. DSM 9736 TaxID=1277350 RepID=UPI000B508268|nr:Na+/H+ antiporter subunit B [Geobacter sp. DSM 9736]SNB46889.1 multisubunit sodium/proton antiporter, MrpB subunit [Geobacter sp. DSM 9736]
MQSLILSTTSRLLLPLLVLFSLFLLLRGHNEPGGGFSGGLVAAAAFALDALAHGVRSARRTLGIDPLFLVSWGLLVALTAGVLPLASGLPFLTGLWIETGIPGIGAVGTPLLFDFGVYLVVTGMVLLVVFSLMEE